MTNQVSRQVHRARRSRSGQVAARIGLGSRAVVYVALTALVVQLAAGHHNQDTDQAGALRALGGNTAGIVVLWLLVAGVACYVLWRWSTAVTGPAGEEDTPRARVQAVIEGAAYLPIAVMAVSVATGNPGKADQGDRYRSLSATVMSQWPAGRLWVGLVGAAVIVLGAYLGSQGPRRSFEDALDFHGHADAERVVTTLGVVGSTARGVVFVLAGVFVVVGACTADPAKAGGIDSALQSLAGQPYGTALLALVAAGLAAFAAFAVGEALYRQV